MSTCSTWRKSPSLSWMTKTCFWVSIASKEIAKILATREVTDCLSIAIIQSRHNWISQSSPRVCGHWSAQSHSSRDSTSCPMTLRRSTRAFCEEPQSSSTTRTKLYSHRIEWVSSAWVPSRYVSTTMTTCSSPTWSRRPSKATSSDGLRATMQAPQAHSAGLSRSRPTARLYSSTRPIGCSCGTSSVSSPSIRSCCKS